MIGEFPQVKIYECGKCLQKDFANIQLLWAHFEKCGEIPETPLYYDWE